MARGRTDARLLFVAIGAVLLLAVAAGGGLWVALERHRVPPPTPRTSDAAAEPLPEEVGPRCGGPVVSLVRHHPSPVEGRTVEAQAEVLLEGDARQLGKTLRVVGWRGIEDRQRRELCRVSLRYQLGAERGATIWLVDPDAEEGERLQPQDRVSVDATGRVPLADPGAEAALERVCSSKGIDEVKGHFSYMEQHRIWGALRKTASEQHFREGGPEVVFGDFRARPEARDRCIVSLDLTEDGAAKTEHYRIRFMPDGEHVVEPLTPRAIESIYGPHVYSR